MNTWWLQFSYLENYTSTIALVGATLKIHPGRKQFDLGKKAFLNFFKTISLYIHIAFFKIYTQRQWWTSTTLVKSWHISRSHCLPLIRFTDWSAIVIESITLYHTIDNLLNYVSAFIAPTKPGNVTIMGYTVLRYHCSDQIKWKFYITSIFELKLGSRCKLL